MGEGCSPAMGGCCPGSMGSDLEFRNSFPVVLCGPGPRTHGGGRTVDLEAGKVIQAIQRLGGGIRDARGKATAWQQLAMEGCS